MGPGSWQVQKDLGRWQHRFFWFVVEHGLQAPSYDGTLVSPHVLHSMFVSKNHGRQQIRGSRLVWSRTWTRNPCMITCYRLIASCVAYVCRAISSSKSEGVNMLIYVVICPTGCARSDRGHQRWLSSIPSLIQKLGRVFCKLSFRLYSRRRHKSVWRRH